MSCCDVLFQVFPVVEETMVEPLKEALQYYQQLKILEDAEAEREMTREQMTREHVTVH